MCLVSFSSEISFLRLRRSSIPSCMQSTLRGVTRRGFSSLRRIQELARAADAAPGDSTKQFLLLRELNRMSAEGPRKLIDRIDSSGARLDDNGWKEYMKAVVNTGRIDDPSFNLTDRFRQSMGGQVMVSGPVVAAPASLPVSWWRTLGSIPVAVMKFLSVTIILVAGWSIVMETASGSLMQKVNGPGSKSFDPVDATNVSLEDVKGCEEVKDEIREIIMYLQDPDRFTRLGAKLPRGVLLSGPPGTGKTLIARAIAGEASVPFFQASGSDFEEMFVGVGAKRIRDLFAAARKSAPCIVFIDEIDALGSKRNARDQSSVRMTLNQLLVELDGFKPNEGVVVICATNLPDSLDKALTRPGRLDKLVVVPLPDLEGRKEILRLYGEKVKLADSVDLEILARRSSGMSGADLFNVINIAAVTASVQNLASIPMSALEDAFDRVVVGLERRNPMSETERRMTAFHEGGHALVSMLTKGADPVHKATIMPRGNALGITWQLPEGPERYSTKLYELRARLAVLMGGKAAEDLEFGPDNVTAGCVSDLQQASGIARKMVMQFGMGGGNKINPIFFNEQDYAYLSDSAKNQVDQQVAELLNEAYAQAHAVLASNAKQLKNLSEALIEFETLGRDDLKLAVAGKVTEIRKMREKERQEREAEKKSLETKKVTEEQNIV
jgi:ATP-dependent metalloprotease